MVIPYSSLNEDWSKGVLYSPKKAGFSSFLSIIKIIDKKLEDTRPIEKIKNTKIVIFEVFGHLNFFRLYLFIFHDYLFEDLKEYYVLSLQVINFFYFIQSCFYFIYRDSKYYKRWKKEPTILNINPTPELKVLSYPPMSEKELKFFQEHHIEFIKSERLLEREALKKRVLESEELELFEISLLNRQNPKMLFRSKKINKYKSRLTWPKKRKTLVQKKALKYARSLKYRTRMKKTITRVIQFKDLIIEITFDFGKVGIKLGKEGVKLGKAGVKFGKPRIIVAINSVKSLVGMPFAIPSSLYTFMYNRRTRKLAKKRPEAETQFYAEIEETTEETTEETKKEKEYKDRPGSLKILFHKLMYLLFFRPEYFVTLAKENEQEFKVSENEYILWLAEKLINVANRGLDSCEMLYSFKTLYPFDQEEPPYTKSANILREDKMDKIEAERLILNTKVVTLRFIQRWLYQDLPIYYRYGSRYLYFPDKEKREWNRIFLFLQLYNQTELKDGE
jgi:hypothetical protein